MIRRTGGPRAGTCGREATKAAVLDAAQRVFLEQGFEGATIKAIADRAGVSPGTVLNAEPTKAALLVAILRTECEQIAESAEQLEMALSGTSVDRLGAILHLMLDGHLRHAELFAAALGYRWLDGRSDFQGAFQQLDFVWQFGAPFGPAGSRRASCARISMSMRPCPLSLKCSTARCVKALARLTWMRPRR